MRIFTNKSFRFDHPAGASAVDSVTVPAFAFSDVPDWVVESSMYKLAAADGDVMIISSHEDEVAAEQQARTGGRKSRSASA